MIFVDDMFDGQAKGALSGRWCHMWTDGTDAELLEFARRIGLRKAWFQTKNPRFHHFDLRESMRNRALVAGASYMPLKDWIQIVHQRERESET